MPNRVDDFVAWKALWWAYRRLRTIRRSSGYNCDPLVTMEWHRFSESPAKARIFLEAQRHPRLEKGIESAYDQALVLSVHGLLRVSENEIPRREAMALEQDVRSVLQAGLADLRTAMGVGHSFDWLECDYDGGELAADREADFVLLAEIGYPQNGTW